tara:strand:+ start:684 stop:995 length:312 start_codon:yes stop_codon:yes gene_type:complete
MGLYGKEVGKRLSDAMKKIGRKDFCVATSWSEHEISISRSCIYRGRIFKLTSDYNSLMMPDGEIREIDSLTYLDISKYLPKSPKIRGGKHIHRHCFSDISLNL